MHLISIINHHNFFLVLSTNDLHFLLTSLWSVRGKWYYFGLALGFPDTDLDAIHKCDNSPDDCLKNVLKKWLHSGHPAKMSVLIKALKSPTVGHEQLADTLLKNFLITADSKCEVSNILTNVQSSQFFFSVVNKQSSFLTDIAREYRYRRRVLNTHG